MKTIKNTVKTELVYNDSEDRRYLLRIEWDKEKKKACVIMLIAGNINGVSYDHTTNYVLENLVSLGYGSVEIVNLFSNIDSKTEDSEDDENTQAIINATKKCDTIVFATGAGYKTNKKVLKRQTEVLAILEKYKNKVYCIADEDGEKFYHPLCPKVRKWNLTTFQTSELNED